MRHLALLISICIFLSCSHPTLRTTHVPAWTKGAVWYQIFPERFRNGDRTAANAGITNYPNWQISPWTSDWYKLQSWEQARSENFHKAVKTSM